MAHIYSTDPNKQSDQVYFLIVKEMVEKKFPGRIELQIIPGGQITRSTQESLSYTAQGTIDLSYQVNSDAQKWDFSMLASYLPGFFKNLSHQWDVTTTMEDLWSDSMEEYGIVCRWLANTTDMESWEVKLDSDPSSPKDLAGLKIEVSGGINGVAANLQRAVDINPVCISIGDLIPGIQTGQLEGAFFTIAPAARLGLIPVCTHLVRAPAASSNAWCAINKKWWDSLPEDIRTYMDEEVLPTAYFWSTVMRARQVYYMEDTWRDGGVKIVDWQHNEELIELFKPAIEAELAKMGPEVQKVRDQFLDDPANAEIYKIPPEKEYGYMKPEIRQGMEEIIERFCKETGYTYAGPVEVEQGTPMFDLTNHRTNKTFTYPDMYPWN
ncbi:MAG: TRAP transporter substrate-binding protein DctP [Chloroflexota bacterium]|nr:TRAP transporter substrate-binding protein DctP [Chloroflexota bacterium]